MSHDEIDRWIEEMPEPKLQLIDGRFVVGNSAAGNRQLLLDLLEGWGAEAAVPFAPAELWWQALHQGFVRFAPPSPAKPTEVWRSWAAQLSYTPEIPPAGPMIEVNHRTVRERLTMSLFGLAHESAFAHVTGRDVIMRLGDDAFTPDVFLTGEQRSAALNDHYLDGPADLVIEVLLPGQEDQDQNLKRQRYRRGGVQDYWMIDPSKQGVELLQQESGEYRPTEPHADGSYRPSSFPGLCFWPNRLWETNDWGRGPSPFTVDQPMPKVESGYAKGGIGWGDLPFDPRPGLDPQPLSFEEFAAWAPEAKFERIDSKPWVGGSRGSRNAVGMLLRTEGLSEAVAVLHPREWITALIQAERDAAEDAARRKHWWAVARQAAQLLRDRFGIGRIAVIGDLVRSQPLNLWSAITLVAIEKGDHPKLFDAGRALYDHFRDEPDLDLIHPKHATRVEKQAIETEAVDL